jgi:signal transduction histidine kinase
MVWYAPPLRITADLPAVLVSAAVAEALAAAVSEALENVVRHAGTGRAAVLLAERPGAVLVTITDDGRGFDQAAVANSGRGFGLREDLAGRMTAVGGSVTVRSSPGAGTAVEVEWPRG